MLAFARVRSDSTAVTRVFREGIGPTARLPMVTRVLVRSGFSPGSDASLLRAGARGLQHPEWSRVRQLAALPGHEMAVATAASDGVARRVAEPYITTLPWVAHV